MMMPLKDAFNIIAIELGLNWRYYLLLIEYRMIERSNENQTECHAELCTHKYNN